MAASRLARLEREARVLASLNHPNIATIYEVGKALASTGDGGDATEVHFLAMELAEGDDLAAWSADRSLIHYSQARRRGDVYLMAPESEPAAGVN